MLSGKESTCKAAEVGSIPELGIYPGEENSNPLLPGQSHGQRSLVGYSPWGCKESDIIEGLKQQQHTTIYETDDQQGPRLEHRELYPIFHNDLHGKKKSKQRVSMCVCVSDSCCYTAESNATSRINSTPIKISKKIKDILTLGQLVSHQCRTAVLQVLEIRCTKCEYT